jgi:hypothetical protein
MGKRWTIPAAILLLAMAAGCRSLAPPNFAQPGTAGQQQRQAVQYDPYPESGPGPEIVGARPPDYEKAPPEVLRARWLPWNAAWGR